ncbi:chondroitin sulfate proteoglycan 4-like [Protopterus annectens]|uniref:chondroitin sulfate proteoglycan 4-like n=1 Tax=Protopterus annectens TaxID=7888 RepID=UPI001CF96598|nr:chondroitin sulfate proteoglycan 4-like [Protopterus annectens]
MDSGQVSGHSISKATVDHMELEQVKRKLAADREYETKQGGGANSSNTYLFLFAASFYGESYIELKTVESFNQVALKLRFRSIRPNGLLFLAAGQNTYCLVELRSGHIQAKVNFGSGEHVLRSEKGILLNDQAWHTVQLGHKNDNVTLTVDEHFRSSTKMPGISHELRTDHGLYVGGSGNLDVLYTEGKTNFRGCIDDVVFNQQELISSLKSFAGHKNVYEVSLGCSEEFFASEDGAVSFFSSRSYIAFPLLESQSEEVFEFAVRTSVDRGLLLYNSGQNGEFLALEIWDGLIQAFAGNNERKTKLSSFSPVNDNNWHYVKLRYTLRHLYLTVNEKTVKASLTFSSKGIGVRSPLFVGGVDDSTRFEVRKFGLDSFSGKHARGGSFKGCLKDLKANSQSIGLKDVLVTKDISAGCEESNVFSHAFVPSATQRSPFPGALSFTSTMSPNVFEYHSTKLSGSSFLVLNNLVVQEGGRASLDSKHIKLNLDFKKLRLRQSQVIFKIKEQPKHGDLSLDIDPEQEQDTFSMLDLWHGRVVYVNHGSEDAYDCFTFSVFANSKKEMPAHLKGDQLYAFNITITPTNDAPELTLPEGNLFVLLENSKKRLTADLLKAVDIDNDPEDLHFTVLGSLNVDAGFLENALHPGKSLTTFPNSELLKGNIYFVHHGVKNSRIVMRVTDGDKVSNTVVLRVMAIPLNYKLINNTGAEVIQGDAVLITLDSLAVETNAGKQEMDIQYTVTEPTTYGDIQELQSSGEWKKITTFSQRSIENSHIRYISTFTKIQPENVTDHFKFKINIGNTVSQEDVFLLKIKWVVYNILKNVPLEIDKAKKETLTSKHLYTVLEGVDVPENEIYYRLLSLPQKGRLLLNNKVLKKNSTVNQRSVSGQKLKYVLTTQPLEDTEDSFDFQLSSKHLESGAYKFQINIKADLNSVILTNKGLSVVEGEGKLITKADLFAETLNEQPFYYKVINSPMHGKLKRINLSNSFNSNDNITTFTNQDILEERLLYVHDDSETVSDQFVVTASTRISEEADKLLHKAEPVSVKILFNISVVLKNDEKPVRVVDQIFHVTKRGQKLLTLEDLCYHDSDSDFSDDHLVYTRRGIPNGELVLVNETSVKLYQFKQLDLKQKRVLFIHQGADYGRFVLFVSDGKHYTSSLLEVQASEPYLKVANNTGLLVQKGHEGTVTIANFSITTNLDIRHDKDIVYNVILLPNHGKLYVNNRLVETFTHHELKMGHVRYAHDDSNNFLDRFNVTVKVKDLQLHIGISIRIYLESHQRPPRILHNSTLLVEEGKPVKISKQKLQVVHDDSSPSEIMYTVKTAPAYGYIRSFSETDQRYIGTEQKPIQSFTQQDINDGDIQYVQITADRLTDTFLVDVTNGITELTGIQVFVDIVPQVIPLKVNNFTVLEGGSKALTEDYIKISNPHFAGFNSLYEITEQPKNGHIENSRFPGIKLSTFTRKQVEQELIYYVHDDSETLYDNFTIIVNDTELGKQSLPQEGFITVMPVNDNGPVVTANKVFRVWVGSVTKITADDLRTEDKDSPPEKVIYSLTPPSNGHVALKSSPHKDILNFTQAHINEGQLVFVHSGAMSGGFSFQASDEQHFAPRQIFSITAQALLISLETNKVLEVFPGSTKQISSGDLKAITNDVKTTGNRTLTFNIVSQPKLGRLVKSAPDGTVEDVSSFTQDSISEGLIAYEHRNTDGLDWSAEDSFSFVVSSPPATLEAHTFQVSISYDNTGPNQLSRLLVNTGAFVTEGDKVLINKSKLDASNVILKLPVPQRSLYEVWYQVTSLPKHGVIVVGERNITKEKPNFSQYIINKFGITYVHDNSESLTDNFTFAVWLNLKSKSAAKPMDDSDVIEEMFNITITPVNDQAPELKTKAPSLRVIQGHSAVLTPANLEVFDLDNSPEEIKYTIISNPSNGFLAMHDNLNESIQHFTQADINSGHIWFIQDGSPNSGVLYFSVTDGKHRPLYKLFNLEIIPIVISFINLTDLVLQQGQTCIAITAFNLAAETNKRNTSVKYRITRPPASGYILNGTEQISVFDQEAVAQESLSYHMTNLSASQDSFEFTVFTSESSLTNQVVNITVEPLVRVASGVTVPSGIVYKLRKEVLDASSLANLTGSIPKFEITSPPVYSRLKSPRYRRDADVEISNVFTQKDIEQGLVLLEVNASTNLTGPDALNDSFSFVLSADNVQPAHGRFLFTVVPYDPSYVVPSTTAIPLTTSSQPLNNQTAVEELLLVTTQEDLVTQAPWRNRNRWGNQSHSLVVPEVTIAESVQEVTVRPENIKPVASSKDSMRFLSVILPIAGVVLLLILVIIGIMIIYRKTAKSKPLIVIQPDSPVTSSPSFHHAERSLVVPSVTVTPLIKRAEINAYSPPTAVKQKQIAVDGIFSAAVTPLYNLTAVDPEILQYCRVTNPTLKRNQYWV